MTWVGNFEMVVPTFYTARCHFPKYHILNNNSDENLKSQTEYYYYPNN
jgi:hypothetical protein